MSTRYSLPLAALAAATFAGGVLANPESKTPGEGGRPLTATLTGAAERPDPGDPDASGSAEIRVNAGQNRICYTLTVANIDAATAAHIHRAPPAGAGPAVVPLQAPSTGSSKGCADVTKELAQEIIRDPAAFYVNVHNAAFPKGAARGQLAR